MPGLYIKDDRCLDHLSDLQLGELQFYATFRLLVVDLCNFPVQQGGECSGAGQNCKPNILIIKNEAGEDRRYVR